MQRFDQIRHELRRNLPQVKDVIIRTLESGPELSAATRRWLLGPPLPPALAPHELILSEPGRTLVRAGGRPATAPRERIIEPVPPGHTGQLDRLADTFPM